MTEGGPSADTTPPSIPTSVSAIAISSTQATISWDPASDNIGVTGYNVYRDGQLIASVPGLSFDDTGLTSGTGYDYQVTASDAANNESLPSNTVTTTTISAPANQAPTLDPIGPQNIDEGQMLAFTVTANDPDAGAVLTLTHSGALPGTASFIDNGNGTGDFSWITTVGDAAGSPYGVTFTVTDLGGLSDSEIISITVVDPISVNTLPLALAQNVSLLQDTTANITLGFSDGDGPGPYVFTLLQAPTNGVLGSDDGDASVSYTSNAGYTGPDSFTFRVNDGLDDSSEATVSLKIN